MNNALTSFMFELKQLNRSPETLANYLRDLQIFQQYLAAEQSEAINFAQNNQAWLSVTPKMVQGFLASRMANGISAKTLARQLSAIRSFYRYLIAQGWAVHNPAHAVKSPKQKASLPKSVQVDTTQQLLEQPLSSWQDVRDQAMFELLYSAGIRLAELVNLDVSPGLDGLASGWVLVMGKGKKERQALVGKQAKAALQAWMQIREQHCLAGESAVFVSRLGKRISPRTVQKNLDKRALNSGVLTKMSPHRLRHACATHVLESSGDLRAVQEMLGHANLATTQIYTKLDLQHLAKVYDQTHPRARKHKP